MVAWHSTPSWIIQCWITILSSNALKSVNTLPMRIQRPVLYSLVTTPQPRPPTTTQITFPSNINSPRRRPCAPQRAGFRKADPTSPSVVSTLESEEIGAGGGRCMRRKGTLDPSAQVRVAVVNFDSDRSATVPSSDTGVED
ncbi:hypothetical protein BDR03DRAFT_966037 [Suillus americanus]|nr:hypothetical protein BDR03DRAFT_966037 [Suillus americanus]